MLLGIKGARREGATGAQLGDLLPARLRHTRIVILRTDQGEAYHETIRQ